MSWLCFKKLFFGQTLPVFNATGTQGKFNASYILPAPFLKGSLSPNFTLVPWGKINRGLLLIFILFLILSKKFKLSFVVVSLTISIEPIFFKYQPNKGIFRSSFLRIKMGYCKGAWSINVSSKD